jgi:hypothetical protein
VNKRRICIECHHAIQGATATQELHKRCSKLRDGRAHAENNRSTTRGNSVATCTAKGPEAPRLKHKTALTFANLQHAPADKFADWINRIAAGEMSVTG